MLKKIKINEHEIEISNMDKILFPKSGITKGDLIIYYKDIASIVLPFYENCPLTMERCPNGIQQQCFIQKETPDYFPEWIDRTELTKKEGHIKQVLLNKAAIMVYLVNQACITFHLSLSKVDKIHYPSYLIFDLDPSIEDISLLKTVAKRVKEFLDHLDLKGFIQTTGSRGFHVYVPLKREFAFKEVHAFAKNCATYLAEEYPQEITIEQSKEKRGKRILIDYARNSYGMSVVAPYSVRTKENAPIATPLDWDELEDKNLHSQSYHIKNIFKRLSQIKGPWSDMLNHQCSLEKSLIKLETIMNSKKVIRDDKDDL